jgi:hypothetical protein
MAIYLVPVGRFTVKIDSSAAASFEGLILDPDGKQIPFRQSNSTFFCLKEAEAMEADAKKMEDIHEKWNCVEQRIRDNGLDMTLGMLQELREMTGWRRDKPNGVGR